LFILLSFLPTTPPFPILLSISPCDPIHIARHLWGRPCPALQQSLFDAVAVAPLDGGLPCGRSVTCEHHHSRCRPCPMTDPRVAPRRRPFPTVDPRAPPEPAPPLPRGRCRHCRRRSAELAHPVPSLYHLYFPDVADTSLSRGHASFSDPPHHLPSF
jgi:hypothetical protein